MRERAAKAVTKVSGKPFEKVKVLPNESRSGLPHKSDLCKSKGNENPLFKIPISKCLYNLNNNTRQNY